MLMRSVATTKSSAQLKGLVFAAKLATVSVEVSARYLSELDRSTYASS